MKASMASAGTSRIPTLRVSAAKAPRSAASAHLFRLANQKVEIERNRKRDSLYGARKKKAVGKIAM